MHEEIREAQLRVEEHIKAKVDAIALRVLSAYSIERMGTRLVIEVDQSKVMGGNHAGQEAGAVRAGHGASALRTGG
jgi:hypothetical protein